MKTNFDKQEVGWNSSNLFYIYLSELDMDYRDAYYDNDYDKMYKVFKLRYMKVKAIVNKAATDNELLILNDDTVLKNTMNSLKPNETDHASRFNNSLIMEILDIIEIKMDILNNLMTKCKMNVLLNESTEYIPAALEGDDFVIQ